MVKRTNLIITLLIFIIVVLAGILIYAFLIQPALTGYATDRQVEGAQIAVSSILQKAIQCEPITLQISEDQSINLIAIECLQNVPSS